MVKIKEIQFVNKINGMRKAVFEPLQYKGKLEEANALNRGEM
jgi:hypothetical protein